MIREITLLVDDADYRDISAELQIRDSRPLPEAEEGANIEGSRAGRVRSRGAVFRVEVGKLFEGGPPWARPK